MGLNEIASERAQNIHTGNFLYYLNRRYDEANETAVERRKRVERRGRFDGSSRSMEHRRKIEIIRKFVDEYGNRMRFLSS